MSVRTLALGELRLQLRQPFSLLLLMAFPILLGLVAAAMGAAMAESGAEQILHEQTGIASDAKPDSKPNRRTPVHAEGEWVEILEQTQKFEIVSQDQALAELRVNKQGEPWVRFAVNFDSLRASNTLRTAIRKELQSRRRTQLREAGMETAPGDLVRTTTVDEATPQARSGSAVGTVLPGFLMFALVVAGLVTSLDVFTGEKERQTIETLLTTRVDRRSVAFAKLTTVAVSTIFAGVLFLVSLAAGQLIFDSEVAGGAIGATEMSWMLLVNLLLGMQVAGITALLGIYADDYKSASMLSAPLMLIVMLPAAAPFFPVDLNLGLAAVPLANVALAARGLLAATISPLHAAAVSVFSLVHVAGATWLVARMLDREHALIGTASVLVDGSRRSTFRQGLGLFAMAFWGMWFFAQTAQMLDLIWGMVFTQLAVIALPGIAAVAWLGLPMKEQLSLRAPTARDGMMAIAVGLLAPAVGLLVFHLQTLVMPAPASLQEEMAKMLSDDLPLLVTLVVFAVLPGLCEEVLFRGALFGLMRRGDHPWLAIALNAVMFGVFHLFLHRWLPTGILGLLMCIAVWRSRSLWVGVVIHSLNNAVLLTIARTLPDPETSEVPWLVLGVMASAAFALVFAMRGPSEVRS